MVAPEKIIIEIEMRLKKAQKDLQAYTKETNKMAQIGSDQFAEYEKRLKKVTEAQTKLEKVAGRTQKQFAGWAMSLMFAGMALQRIFQQVWKFGSQTFQDVMHSVDGTTTSFDMLQGSLKYLGFSVGEALEPLAASLIPIVDFITDLVQRNPEMVSGILKWTGILGTTFMVGGSGVLALNGLWELQNKIMGANTSGLDLVNTLGRIMGTLIVIDVAMKVITGKEDMFTMIDNLLLGAGLMAGATTPWGAALITVGVAFKLMSSDFKERVVNFLGGVVGSLITAFNAVFETILSPLVGFYNTLVRGYNLISGENVPTMDTYARTKSSAQRTADLFTGAFAKDSESRDSARERVANYEQPQIFVTVELDGEAVSNTFFQRLQARMN